MSEGPKYTAYGNPLFQHWKTPELRRSLEDYRKLLLAGKQLKHDAEMRRIIKAYADAVQVELVRRALCDE